MKGQIQLYQQVVNFTEKLVTFQTQKLIDKMPISFGFLVSEYTRYRVVD